MLYHWEQGKLSRLFYQDGANVLVKARDESIWFDRDLGSDDEHGLIRFKDGRLMYYKSEDGLSDNHATCMLEDQQGNLWIGTYSGGLNCWQPRRFPTLGTAQGLVNEKVRTLAPARNGGVWVGTDEGISA